MIGIGNILAKSSSIEIEVLRHEVAIFSQHEINFRGSDAEFVGDAIQTV
jgi:glutamine synthetase